MSPAFRATLDGLVNPYGDGQACKRIVDALLAHFEQTARAA